MDVNKSPCIDIDTELKFCSDYKDHFDIDALVTFKFILKSEKHNHEFYNYMVKMNHKFWNYHACACKRQIKCYHLV